MKFNIKKLNNNNNRNYSYSTCDYYYCASNPCGSEYCNVNRREWNTNSSAKGGNEYK